MFPLLRNNALPARAQRLFFFLYCVRHVMGITTFAWVCVAGSQIGNRGYFYLLLAGLAVYVVTAVLNGIKLWQRYQLRVKQEKEATHTYAILTTEEAE